MHNEVLSTGITKIYHTQNSTYRSIQTEQLLWNDNCILSVQVHSLFKKVKQSHYRPGQAQRVPGGWGSQISWQSAHEGGKVVSPMHRPPLPSRKYSWYSFLLEAESTPRPQCSWKDYAYEKNPVTPSGIEPATFWLVAQCLNLLCYRVPHILYLQYV